jgi:hypothetical protein
LLEEALTDAGKSPQTEFCRWNDGIKGLPTIMRRSLPTGRMRRSRWFYHLFRRPRGARLTGADRDDHFQFLVGWARNKDLIPKDVRRALSGGALTFLGFHIDDWSFRVVFYGISVTTAAQRRRRHASMTVQIDPEEGRILDPERASGLSGEVRRARSRELTFTGAARKTSRESCRSAGTTLPHERSWTNLTDAAAMQVDFRFSGVPLAPFAARSRRSPCQPMYGISPMRAVHP